MSKEGSKRNVTEPRFQPNATWVCGHTDLGLACSHGPSANGKCGGQTHACAQEQQTSTESACSKCVLACHKRGNTDAAESPWRECEALASAPCVPVRSAWSFRNRLALNLAIATAGLLLCLMAFPQREATFVPGGLSRKHAQILDNEVVSDRCSLCHPNSHTLSATTGTIATQDELCTRCHEGHLPKLHLRSPHDMERDTLKQLTLDALSSRGLLVSTRSNHSRIQSRDSVEQNEPEVTQCALLLAASELQTACASCHVEHHGRDNQLQAITDARCQACHSKQFESFGNGHPELDNYPVAKSRRIAFTHQAHLEKHFAKKNESFDCTKCHLDSNQRGGVGSVFRTLSFETACARCHNEPISAAAADGWVLLQLPSVKPSDAQSSALGLNGWPTTAQFGYEGTVPLVMRTLLLADEDCEKALKQLPASGDIKSIPDFVQVGRDATISIAVGTRTLIEDIAAGGQAAWRKRLERVLTQSLARELSPREVQLVDNLCAGLPPDVFRQIQQNWFGSSAAGIASRTNVTPRTFLPIAQIISPQDKELLPSSTNEENDDDLLGGPQLNNTRVTEQVAESKSNDDLLLGNSMESTISGGPEKLTRLRGAIHVLQGGWYVDNETLTLRYMPRGHSDPILAAWSEFATLLASSNVNEANTSTSIHADLSRQVPGGCTQCHVLGIEKLMSLDQLLWKADSKPVMARSITKFDHTPHLTLPNLSDCRYCHQLDSTSNARTNLQFATTLSKQTMDSAQLPTCEFKSMHLEQCIACHRPNAASTGCTQCHNYHVTDVSTLGNSKQ